MEVKHALCIWYIFTKDGKYWGSSAQYSNGNRLTIKYTPLFDGEPRKRYSK